MLTLSPRERDMAMLSCPVRPSRTLFCISFTYMVRVVELVELTRCLIIFYRYLNQAICLTAAAFPPTPPGPMRAVLDSS